MERKFAHAAAAIVCTILLLILVTAGLTVIAGLVALIRLTLGL